MHRPSIRTSPCPKRLAELLAATAAKDEPAFAELYDSTRRKLFGIALMVLRRRDLAEDVTQEAFIRIWRSAASFDPARGMPITWMATIVRNLAIDVKRSPAAEPTDDSGLSVIPFNGRSALEELEASDNHRRLREAMKTLDPLRRKLVIAAYINGESREQLSRRFGAPVNTIKTWLRRAVLDIRAAIEANDVPQSGGPEKGEALSVPHGLDHRTRRDADARLSRPRRAA
jgi:RNA polymerase sigma-70 factor (ECF subfamily)